MNEVIMQFKKNGRLLREERFMTPRSLPFVMLGLQQRVKTMSFEAHQGELWQWNELEIRVTRP